MRFVLSVAAAIALIPGVASAHLVSTGFGPVTDGAYHFALSPEQFLPLAAFALFAGLRGPAHARLIMFILPLAWLAVGTAGAVLPGGRTPVAMAGAFLATGGLLAADIKLPPTVSAILAALLGALCGSAYGAGDSPLLAALGAAVAIFVLLALVSSAVLSLRAAWGLIAVRVLGSWTAATGLLLAGWTLHGRS